MAPPSPREHQSAPATSATKPDAEMVLPGFPDADSFVKFALGSVVAVTKASGGLPQFGDEYDFYRSFPAFQAFCETQGDRLLQCMSRVMQYHGCRSNIKDRSKVTELEDKFDLLVDTTAVITLFSEPNTEEGGKTPLTVAQKKAQDICLKKFVKPIFTDESYLELYRKQKKHLNSQQLTAFQLLFAWRDKTARREDESKV